MRFFFLFFMGLALCLGGVWLCSFQVDESEFVIVARFGDPRRVISEAGLYFKAPPPMDAVVRIDRRIRILDPAAAEFLTADKKNVLVSSFMAWSVEDPVRFFVSVNSIKGAEARLHDVMSSETGTILGANDLSVLVHEQPVHTGKGMDAVTAEITKNAAKKALESFGIKVWSVRFRRLSFPLQNKEAVFRRMEAERQRIAMRYRSEGEEEAGKIRAKADRDRALTLAEARRKADEIRGEADAEASRIYAEAFGKDPEFFEFLRSLEAYEAIFKPNSTLVVPSNSPILKVLQDPKAFSAKPETP